MNTKNKKIIREIIAYKLCRARVMDLLASREIRLADRIKDVIGTSRQGALNVMNDLTAKAAKVMIKNKYMWLNAITYSEFDDILEQFGRVFDVHEDELKRENSYDIRRSAGGSSKRKKN